MTEKLNPQDSDIILVVDEDAFKNMHNDQKRFVNWFSSADLTTSHYCDNYVMVRGKSTAEHEYNYAYWLRQFGFSRGNQMKGLAVIQVPFVVMP